MDYPTCMVGGSWSLVLVHKPPSLDLHAHNTPNGTGLCRGVPKKRKPRGQSLHGGVKFVQKRSIVFCVHVLLHLNCNQCNSIS